MSFSRSLLFFVSRMFFFHLNNFKKYQRLVFHWYGFSTIKSELPARLLLFWFYQFLFPSCLSMITLGTYSSSRFAKCCHFKWWYDKTIIIYHVSIIDTEQFSEMTLQRNSPLSFNRSKACLKLGRYAIEGGCVCIGLPSQSTWMELLGNIFSNPVFG